MYEYLSPENIRAFIEAALREDVGPGDHSTLSCIPPHQKGKARLMCKSDGILAGVELAQAIFRTLDPEIQFEIIIPDGEPFSNGDIAFLLTGNARAILSGERLALNCMQRMSGIATKTHQLASLIKDTDTRLLDTRKTTPNFRLPEKWAVKIGGGHNHRYGLFDMIMLKDNHIDYCGGVSKALQKTQEYLEENGLELKIVVEIRRFGEIEEALSNGGVYRLLLDNMKPEEVQKAVNLIGNRCQTEASGNISEANIREYAEAGVNFVSLGALTHSARSLDLSLKAVLDA